MESTKITIMDLADEVLLQIFSYDVLHRQDLHLLAIMSNRFSSLAAVNLYNIVEYLSIGRGETRKLLSYLVPAMSVRNTRF